MSSIASSSSSKHYCIAIRNPTPPKRHDNSIRRVFPQSLEEANYPKNENGLYIKENFNFIYEQDLKKIGVTPHGVTRPELVSIKGYDNKQYILKNNYVLAKSLPPNSNRTQKLKTLQIQYMGIVFDDEELVYHSNSRVAIQIMYQNLLKFFLRNREDVIIPDIHPVFDKNNGEICGMISEKIHFQEGKTVAKDIMKKFQETKIPFLMKILGIYDILNQDKSGHYISNTGLTADKKLVFFDFGRNLLDSEYLKRHAEIDLCGISYNNKILNESFKQMRDKCLEGYNTTNDKNGLANTIHPDIENIIMSTGPGDENFRKEMAKIIQTRINNAFIVS